MVSQILADLSCTPGFIKKSKFSRHGTRQEYWVDDPAVWNKSLIKSMDAPAIDERLDAG